MEPKTFHLNLCIIFLFFLLNPFIMLSHAKSNHRPNNSSAMAFLKTLTGTRKGNTAKGLSQLKKYLSKLGYMNDNKAINPSNKNPDFFDDNLESAIKKFQQFVNLQVNGFLDANTIAKLNLPRCGVPDYANANTTRSKYTFFPNDLKWPPSKRNLTYSFPKGTRTDLKPAILEATRIWSNVSPFRFTYITDYNKADIKISFQHRDHGDGSPFDGTGGVLAHAFAPSDGRLHLDEDEKWWNGISTNAYDIQTVGLHELGHVLGLGHSSDGGAIMWPYIGSESRKSLGQDDINGLKALYKFK